MPDIRDHSNELLHLITEALPMEGEPALAWDDNEQCASMADSSDEITRVLHPLR